MRSKSALAALTAVGTVILVSALWAPAIAMGPVGPSATSKADSSLVEKVNRRWRRGYYGYYPRARWYGYGYRPYYYSGYQPYYYRPYRPYYYPYYGGYGAYYGPSYYGGGYGFYGPRFGLRIGF